jgi:hypothetical protein
VTTLPFYQGGVLGKWDEGMIRFKKIMKLDPSDIHQDDGEVFVVISTS